MDTSWGVWAPSPHLLNHSCAQVQGPRPCENQGSGPAEQEPERLGAQPPRKGH